MKSKHILSEKYLKKTKRYEYTNKRQLRDEKIKKNEMLMFRKSNA